MVMEMKLWSMKILFFQNAKIYSSMAYGCFSLLAKIIAGGFTILIVLDS